MAYLGRKAGSETVDTANLIVAVKRSENFDDIVAEVTVEENVAV